uniref:hypothetical protein n=1 Tax=Marinitenerispora sediminis TaxID=1931232 RepID=UPI001F3FDEA0|nr:hypothetical protein [Marinitenerispora sediminis]
MHLLTAVPIAPGPCPVVGDKRFAGAGIEAAMAGLGHVLIRPARADEPDTGVFPGWLRQRIEAVIWTLKNQLGLKAPRRTHHRGAVGAVCQRVLALNAAICTTG